MPEQGAESIDAITRKIYAEPARLNAAGMVATTPYDSGGGLARAAHQQYDPHKLRRDVAVVVPRATLTTVNAHVNELLAGLAAIEQRMQKMAEHLAGEDVPAPECETSDRNPIIGGQVGALLEQLNNLYRVEQGIVRALERLEAVL